MDKKLKNYRDLRIWKEGIDLVKVIYTITALLPEEEKFSLISQMKRSAVSIPSNIAEGFRRQYKKEFKQFLFIAISSLAELETQTTISKELGYINAEKEDYLLSKTDALSRMINSLIKKL